ncbi:hypothetical protein JL721_12998 [Aureococcus anophagefferens]|nr:hypothetical protein JL721_12998 [Aureococcus anophagefferens]
MASKSIIDLEKCIDKEVRVKFQGGREVRGVLKGFDQLVNIVLDNCVECARRAPSRVSDASAQVSLVSPVYGMASIKPVHPAPEICLSKARR